MVTPNELHNFTMKSFIIAVFISTLVLQLHTANYCEIIEDLPNKWTVYSRNRSHQHSCCELSEGQWNLIVWYFLRVSSNVNVTQIVNESEPCVYERYVNHLLNDLNTYVVLEYYMHRLIYRKRDQILDKKHELKVNSTYKWHVRQEDTYSTGDDGKKFHFRNKLSKQNCIREDEPRYGSVVLASNFEIVDNFLNGVTRYPFLSKQSHYIILIYGSISADRWEEYSSSIMTKLWKKHGILDAIILSSCDPQTVNFQSISIDFAQSHLSFFFCISHLNSQVGVFDPFANTRYLGVTDPGIDEWGMFRCLPIKYLDFSDTWLVQKEYKLNGYPINVSIFERYPSMVKKIPKYFAPKEVAKAIKKSGYGGYDGLVFGNLATQMNFSINAALPTDNKTYGYKENGKFTGTLGDIIEKRSEIAANSRFVISYDTMDIRFMIPIVCDQLCVIIPAAETIPKWQAIIRCFDSSFWFASISITCLTSMIYTVVKFYHEKYEMRMLRESVFYKDFKNVIEEHEITIKNVHTLVWSVMFGRITMLPKRTIERLIIGACMIANVIIAGSLESSLYKLYTEHKPKNIDTLKELDESGLRITASSPSFRDVFGNDQESSTIFESLKGKLFLEHTDLSAVERVATKGDIGTLERLSDVNIIIMVHSYSFSLD